jgi:PAS domain S-box-containing protein
VSPQCESILGYRPDELIADRELWFSCIHPDDLERVEREWAAALDRQDRFESDYRWVMPDGSVRWVRDASVLVRTRNGAALFWQGAMVDITSAKRAEEKLRESSARYRFLVENIPAVVYTVAPDDDRRTLYVSPHVERALGYSRLEWLEQPDIWMELLHPDDREPTLAAHDRHNETGEPWSREYRLIASDGRAVWIRDVATLVRDEDGRPAHWHGVQLDITEPKRVEDELRAARDELERRVQERTGALEDAEELMSLEIAERRRAEEDLRATEHRYRLLAEHLPAVTYTWQVDPSTSAEPRYYTSPRIEQLLGYTVDEWHRQPDFWMTRLHPDDRAAVLEATVRSESAGEPFSMEYRFLHKDGHIVWVLDEAVLLTRDRHGAPELFQGVMIDLTARKEAEARARQAEVRYRSLVEQMPAITYVELPGSPPGESRLTYVSPQVERILGRTAEQLMADPGHFGRMLHPDDREAVLAANARSEETGEPFDAEYRLVRDDGEIVWLHSRATLVRDERGEPMFWHGVALDVTEQRAAEASLRDLERRYARLADRVARAVEADAEPS